MAWENVVGQEDIKSQLQRLIIENRIPNAFCFWGGEGVGKFATAIEFVKSASCLNKRIEDNRVEHCEQCSNCINISENKFPNLEFVFALPSGKSSEKGESGTLSQLSSEQIETINQQIINKIQNPYSRFAIEGASQIRIGAIRELRRSLSLSNPLPGRKFVIILNAEDMRTEAQNALLKTLEEPRKNVTFILLSTLKEQILPTILSRCQMLFFPILPMEYICRELMSKFGKSRAEAQLIAKFSAGSMTTALEFLESDAKVVRDSMVHFLRLSLKKDLPGSVLSSDITKFAEKLDKKKASAALNLFTQWIRDAFLVSKNGNNTYIINEDDIETLKRFAEKFAKRDLPLVIDHIEEARRYIFSNVNISQIFLDLFMKIRITLWKSF